MQECAEVIVIQIKNKSDAELWAVIELSNNESLILLVIQELVNRLIAAKTQ